MVSWQVVYAKQAQKDASKFANSGLKAKAQELLAIIKAMQIKVVDNAAS